MFGYQGGESPETVARKQGYRNEAQQKWSFLTSYDLTTIKNEEQLSTLVQGRSSITEAQAKNDVREWMEGKQF